MRVAVGLLAGMLGIAMLQPVRADDSAAARVWLDKMAMAVNHFDYIGSLVYARGGNLEAMRVFHRVRKGNVRERLVSLTGPPREVLRDDDYVRCIFPDEKSVLVDSRIADPWFPVIPPDQVADPGTRYEFRLGGTERVAGMDAQVLHIQPKDAYRYGYQLWLEQKSGMLLKSRLLDESGEPLEQVMFTELLIGAVIADADLEPSIRDDGFLQVEFPRQSEKRMSDGATALTIEGLPAGFTLRSRSHRTGDNEQLEHLVFTDGLASVSVYVEPIGAQNDPPLGASEIGPINMFGARVAGYTITAIGEVPSATVKLMARSVRPTQ